MSCVSTGCGLGNANIGGLIIETMRKVPAEDDLITWNCFRLEVTDMDRARIDKVTVALTNPDD